MKGFHVSFDIPFDGTWAGQPEYLQALGVIIDPLAGTGAFDPARAMRGGMPDQLARALDQVARHAVQTEWRMRARIGGGR